MQFERSQDPKASLNIGLRIPNVNQLRNDTPGSVAKKWYDLWQKYINIANRPGKSIPFRKYTRWWVEKGHIRATPKDQVIFEMWVIENSLDLTIEEIMEAANDNWPNSREKFKSEVKRWF